jgi:hypothetical protein
VGRFQYQQIDRLPFADLPVPPRRRKASPSGECVGDIHRDRPAFIRSRAPALTHRPRCGRGFASCRRHSGGWCRARHGLSLRVVRRLVCACRADTEPQGEGSALQTAKIRVEEGGRLRRNAERSAADRRLDRNSESDAVQQRRARGAGAGLDRRAGPSDADGRLQHHREGPLSPLQSLQQRADALHAAHHLVGRGAARRRAAGLSGLARLHSHVARFRPEALARHQARGASYRGSPRAGADRFRAP